MSGLPSNIRGLLRRILRDCAGAAALEFALLVLPFITLMGGMVEAGNLYLKWNILEETAADTARCAGLKTSSCSTTASTQSYAAAAAGSRGFSGLPTSNVSVTTISSAGTSCGGATGVVKVSITFQYAWFVPVMPATNLSATACYPTS